MASSVEAVLFDFGGVLTEGYEEGNFFGELAGKFAVDEQSLKSVFSRTKVMHDLSRGHLDEAEAIRQIRAEIPEALEIEPADITSEFFVPSPAAIKAVADFRTRTNTRIALVSNVFPTSKEAIVNHGVDQIFDNVFFSCDMGTRKPEIAYFQAVFDEMNVAPERCLLIDDTESNLDAARSLGVTAIYPGDGQHLIDFLDNFQQHR